jgi:hypothetical protein
MLWSAEASRIRGAVSGQRSAYLLSSRHRVPSGTRLGTLRDIQCARGGADVGKLTKIEGLGHESYSSARGR